MEDLLKIGATYIRVSDERQDECSPDSQLEKIREYAGNAGYQILDKKDDGKQKTTCNYKKIYTIAKVYDTHGGSIELPIEFEDLSSDEK